jgi:hypothetical protein
VAGLLRRGRLARVEPVLPVGAGHRRRAPGRDPLLWVFNPIRPSYRYRLPAVARVAECEPPERKVACEVSLPGFYERHSYLFELLGPDRSRFGSSEVAEGPAYRRFSASGWRLPVRVSVPDRGCTVDQRPCRSTPVVRGRDCPPTAAGHTGHRWIVR